MFLWDSASIPHIARHNITPEEAEQVVENDPLDIERQLRDGEERMLHLGETFAGRVLFVVVTVRAEMNRVVTAFPADRQARKFYAAKKELEHGKDAGDP
jgi:uncharacterized DUF497 family protein